MSVDTPEQLRGLRRAGRVVAATLKALRNAVAPGVTTAELDALAARMFAKHGARSGPILTYGYPARSASASTTRSFTAFPARERCGRVTW
jgi:methionyl aminopeptidase